MLDILLTLGFFLVPRKKEGIVVCGMEIASNIRSMKDVLPSVKTVSFWPHRFHKYDYDHGPWPKWAHPIMGPFYLVLLSRQADIFVYNWEIGFAYDREIDFRFLKRKGKRIVQIHCGEDIRSHVKMGEYYEKIGWHDHTLYRWPIKALLEDRKAYEEGKKRNAQVSDRYADVIFSKEIDNMSYLEKKVYPFFYHLPADEYKGDRAKFKDIKTIRMVHAPSSPSNKGTPLVRAAIKKLESDGFDFEYVELVGMSHDHIKDALAKSHIVLNQFYSFCHGTFGVEAMLSYNCMLTSADPELTHELFPKAEEAWMVTHYYQIYDHLRILLEHPDSIQGYAERGLQYASLHFSSESCRHQFLDALEREGVISESRRQGLDS